MLFISREERKEDVFQLSSFLPTTDDGGKKKLLNSFIFHHLSFFTSSGLPVDRQQLGLEDERGAAGDLGRGAHRACFFSGGGVGKRKSEHFFPLSLFFFRSPNSRAVKNIKSKKLQKTHRSPCPRGS